MSYSGPPVLHLGQVVWVSSAHGCKQLSVQVQICLKNSLFLAAHQNMVVT
jgi:hypothetical protein